MQMNLKLTGVKAQVPLLTSDISLINQALVRPVVAYLNEHRHYTLPLSFSFSLSVQDDLKGAWGAQEAGIADHLSRGVANAFTDLVNDHRRTGERVRRVGLWSLYSMLKQLTSGASGS
jgi:distribution and morphology protein 31